MIATVRRVTLLLAVLVTSCIDADNDDVPSRTENSLFSVKTGAVYRIGSAATGKCVGITNSSTANNAAAEARTCDGSAGQNFTIAAAANGYYTIKNTKSLKCLDVTGASKADGAAIIQYTCSSTAANQQWAIADTTAGMVRLTSRNSGKVMEVSSGATADGTPIVQRTWTGAAYQNFQLSTGTCVNAVWDSSVWDSTTNCWAP